MTFEAPDPSPSYGGRGAIPGLPDRGGRPPLPGYRQFGDYLLLGAIAQGGMGVVYQAVHQRLNRPCAIKLINSGALATLAERNRLMREAEAGAVLDHPDIVAIRHAGETEGQLYLEMDLVEGCTLAERLAADRAAGVRMAAREAATLVARLALAVQHAHDRGVLHRDLKPGNVLLTIDGAPRLTDFGLARHLDREGDLTRTLAVLGTPAYMAPELAEGRSRSATTAADVYALGAILYECLAGCPPFNGETALAVLAAVRFGIPVPLSRHRPDVPRDLEILVGKALHRDAFSRLSTARDFADELQRWLRGEPIRSRPVPWWQDLQGWARRHPGATGLSIACGLGLVLGLVTALWQANRAEQAAERLAQELALSENRRAERVFDDGEAREGLAHLAASLRRRPDDSLAAIRLGSALTQRTWPRPLLDLGSASGSVQQLAWSPDGELLLTSDVDGRIRGWSVDTGAEHSSGPWWLGSESCSSLEWSGDGRWFVARLRSGACAVWPRQGAMPALSFEPEKAPVSLVRFSPIGARLAVVGASGHQVEVWDLDSGRRVHQWSHSTNVTALDFSPEGRYLVTGGTNGLLRVFDASTGNAVEPELRAAGSPRRIRWHPEGRWFAVISDSPGGVELWRWPEGTWAARHAEVGASLADFTPGGPLIRPVASRAEAVAEDPLTSEVRYRIPGVRDPILPPAFARDGRAAVVPLDALRLQPFHGDTGQLLAEPVQTRWPVEAVELHPDGSRLAVAAGASSTVIWEIPELPVGAYGQTLPGTTLGAEFSSDGHWIWTCDRQGALRAQNLNHPSSSLLHQLSRSPLTRVAFAPDSRLIAVVDEHRALEIFSTTPVASVAGPWSLPGEVSALRWAPEGQGLAVGTFEEEVLWWDLTRLDLVGRWRLTPDDPAAAYGTRITQLEYSPDGAALAVSTYGGIAALLESGAATPRVRLTHGAPVWRIAFSPDGTRFVTASGGSEVQVHDRRSGAPVAPAMLHEDLAFDAQFTADGRHVISAGADGRLSVWHASTGRLIAQVRTPEALHRAGIGAQDRWMTAVGEAARFRLWDQATGIALSEWLPHPPKANRMAIAPDSGAVALWVHGGPVQLHRVALAPRGPVPSWLPEVAEALGGQRFGAQGELMEVTPSEAIALSKRLSGIREPDPFWGSILRRFVSGNRSPMIPAPFP